MRHCQGLERRGKKAMLFVAILEEEEDQGTGTGEGRGTLSSEIPVDMMAANARTPKKPRADATADKTDGECQSEGVRPVEWSLMGMEMGVEQRKTDRDAGSGSGSWGGDAFWSPHSSYAIVPSRPKPPASKEAWEVGG